METCQGKIGRSSKTMLIDTDSISLYYTCTLYENKKISRQIKLLLWSLRTSETSLIQVLCNIRPIDLQGPGTRFDVNLYNILVRIIYSVVICSTNKAIFCIQSRQITFI